MRKAHRQRKSERRRPPYRRMPRRAKRLRKTLARRSVWEEAQRPPASVCIGRKDFERAARRRVRQHPDAQFGCITFRIPDGRHHTLYLWRRQRLTPEHIAERARVAREALVIRKPSTPPPSPSVSEAEAIAVLEAVDRGEVAATYWTNIDGDECYRLPNGWGVAIELDDGGWLEGVVEVWAGDGRKPAHAVDFPGLAAWRPSSVEAGLRMFGLNPWGTPRLR